MPNYSEYIVYADESGTAGLEGAADPGFPVFVLSMVLVRKDSYASEIIPKMQAIKFNHVGHDQLIFHERDIRRQSGNFSFLRGDAEQRAKFIDDINGLVQNAPLEVMAAVIKKPELVEKYADPWSPYEIALKFLMEKLLVQLRARGELGKKVHVCFECRGKKEDKELELTFRRIADNQLHWGYRAPNFRQMDWEPVFIDKKSNCSGLQLADLFARPIGLSIIRPDQPNRAYELISEKLCVAVKVFP